MILIFKLISSSKRRNLTTVCRNWLGLVNDYFPQDNRIVITKHSDFSSLFWTFYRRSKVTKKMPFPYLVIKSFSTDFIDLYRFSRFLELIGDEVKYLQIHDVYLSDLPNNWLNEKAYSKMANLRKLEVDNISYLGDLSFPEKLQAIHVNDEYVDLKRLENIRSKKLIPELTCDIIKYSVESQKLRLSFISDKLKALLNEMRGTTTDKWKCIEIKSSFNYCGESQMTPECISELKFHEGMSSIAPAVHFVNLKVIPVMSSSSTLFYHQLLNITENQPSLHQIPRT